MVASLVLGHYMVRCLVMRRFVVSNRGVMGDCSVMSWGGMMHRHGGMVNWSFVVHDCSMMSHCFMVDRSCVMGMGSNTMSMSFLKRGEMGILVVRNSLVMNWGGMVLGMLFG